MQTQHISDIYPNVISITKIRKDIDALMVLLEKYSEVKVLKGQKVMFKIVKATKDTSKEEKMKEAVDFFKNAAKTYGKYKAHQKATEWLIKERDKMRTKTYYEEHNR